MTNRESGYGRYDMQLMPRENDFPGILIELKAMKHCDHLKILAAEALQQIKEKGYARPYLTDARKLYQIGVNFSSETGTIEGFNYE